MGKFKDAIQPLMDQHSSEVREVRKSVGAMIDAWKKDTIYSDSYKAEQIKELEQQMKAQLAVIDGKYNKQIKEIVMAEKAAIIGDQGQKAADYQVQIANALKFIELAGKNLSDDQAYGILKPFQGDYETMSLFRSAINGLAGSLENRFEKTFKKTNDFVVMMNNFETVEKTVGNLYETDRGTGAAIKVEMFKGSVDAIDQIAEAFQNL
jgi:hypothetical protein